MLKSILLALAVFGLLAVSFVFIKAFRPAEKIKLVEVKIGNEIFKVEIADNFSSRARGLSGRDGLGSHEGMLFIFPVAMPQGFWMKDMKFPIDIIWIRDSKAIGMIIGAEPEPGPDYTIYSSPEPADMVLEVNAGTAQRFGMKIGDAVELKNGY